MERSQSNSTTRRKKLEKAVKQKKSKGSSRYDRVIWNEEVRRKFTHAVKFLGVDYCTPTKILQLLDIPGLSRDQVAGHLKRLRQKMRDMKEFENLLSPLVSSDSEESPELSSGREEPSNIIENSRKNSSVELNIGSTIRQPGGSSVDQIISAGQMEQMRTTPYNKTPVPKIAPYSEYSCMQHNSTSTEASWMQRNPSSCRGILNVAAPGGVNSSYAPGQYSGDITTTAPVGSIIGNNMNNFTDYYGGNQQVRPYMMNSSTAVQQGPGVRNITQNFPANSGNQQVIRPNYLMNNTISANIGISNTTQNNFPADMNGEVRPFELSGGSSTGTGNSAGVQMPTTNSDFVNLAYNQGQEHNIGDEIANSTADNNCLNDTTLEVTGDSPVRLLDKPDQVPEAPPVNPDGRISNPVDIFEMVCNQGWEYGVNIITSEECTQVNNPNDDFAVMGNSPLLDTEAPISSTTDQTLDIVDILELMLTQEREVLKNNEPDHEEMDGFHHLLNSSENLPTTSETVIMSRGHQAPDDADLPGRDLDKRPCSEI